MPNHKDDWTAAKGPGADSPTGANPPDEREREADVFGSAAAPWSPPPWVTPVVDGEAPDATDPDLDRTEMVERERWLRDYVDREQRVRLFVAEYLVGLLKNPPLWMRVWRWLIDDVRSERRAEAELLLGRPRGGLLPWLSDRRRRRLGR
jgi:hypothetical protein